MRKRITCMILSLIMIFSIVPSATAASNEATEAAEALYELGLFKGTGANPDGTPIFDLDKTPTRNQAIIMLVRLLGKEEEAKAGTWNIPFTDVSDSMKPYIGYAYANGLTNGTSATTYSGTNPIRVNQYITFVLRALGYTSGVDFSVSTAWSFSDQIGLTKGNYSATTSRFTRGDVAQISYSALSLPQNGVAETLASKLIREGVFTQAQYNQENKIIPNAVSVVEVSTSSELLNSICSNRKIILTSQYYDLSNLNVKTANVSKQVDPYYGELDSYVIKNISNLTIEGNAEIVTNDLYADVLKFENCNQVTLSGLTIGHVKALKEYECEGSVLRFDDSKDISVKKCNLFGCGAEGIYADNTQGITVDNSKIYECTYSSIWLTGESQATVNNSSFYDSRHFSGFLRIDNSTISCNKCNINNIVAGEGAGFVDTFDFSDKPSTVSFTACSFTDNVFDCITNDDGNKKISFTNCTFTNNVGIMQHPTVSYFGNTAPISSQKSATSEQKILFIKYLNEGIKCNNLALECLTYYVRSSFNSAFFSQFNEALNLGYDYFNDLYSMSKQYSDFNFATSSLQQILQLYDEIYSGNLSVVQMGNNIGGMTPYYESILSVCRTWL